MSDRRLIFGCGYLGLRVAKLWRDAGFQVFAATRSDRRIQQLRRLEIEPFIADVTKPESLFNLPNAESVLFAVGFDREAGSDIQSVYAGGVWNVLAALAASTNRLIDISTTGVYGNAGGDWVDEQTPPDPQREGGLASLAAEDAIHNHPLGKRSVILRMGGIYGPGRVPNVNSLRRGEAIPVPKHGWLNLIHVQDAARIVVAADAWMGSRMTDDGPHVFCVSDGAPVVRGQYYAEMARLLGGPPPTFADPSPHSPVAARAAADRRVSNAKVARTLGVELDFPSYLEGLASILSGEINSDRPVC